MCGGYVVDSSLVELPDTMNNVTLNVRIGIACGIVHGISVGCKESHRFEYLYTMPYFMSAQNLFHI